MSVEFLGRKIAGIDVPNVSVSKMADWCAEMVPEIWRAVNVKVIDAPGNYLGFKAAAVAFTGAITEIKMRGLGESAANNIAACVGMLQRYNYPTYYVVDKLLSAIRRTKPPKDMTWESMKLPFPALMFMLPRGVLFEPDGGEIIMMGITLFPADETIRVPGTEIGVTAWKEPRLSAFWMVYQGFAMQDCTFPPRQALEPEPGWIEQATRVYRERFPTADTGVSGEFSSYMVGLIANLILVMQARPEIIEAGGATGKRVKSGLPIHRPTFIGRKYELLRRERKPAEMEFTELDWRCGHLRLQHYGAKGQQTKTIWIDPYVAYVRGLQQKNGK